MCSIVMYVLYSDVVSISIYLLFIVRYTSDKFDVFAMGDVTSFQ